MRLAEAARGKQGVEKPDWPPRSQLESVWSFGSVTCRRGLPACSGVRESRHGSLQFFSVSFFFNLSSFSFRVMFFLSQFLSLRPPSPGPPSPLSCSFFLFFFCGLLFLFWGRGGVTGGMVCLGIGVESAGYHYSCTPNSKHWFT